MILSCQSEIICDYADYLLKHNNYYNLGSIPTDNNTSVLWIKAFDEFISNNKNRWPGLRFSPNTFNGKYIELLISSSGSSTPYIIYNTPVINIRSSLGTTSEIKFLNRGNSGKWINAFANNNPQKYKDQFFSYQLPINKFRNIALNNFNPSQGNSISINWLNTLIEEICQEYYDILNNRKNGVFSL